MGRKGGEGKDEEEEMKGGKGKGRKEEEGPALRYDLTKARLMVVLII